MKEIAIWKPVEFDPAWLKLNTEQIDQVLPAWFEKRASIKDDNVEMKEFFERIKRRQAIETGIVEGLYTLSRGATETFVMQGFAEDYLQHGDTNVSNEQLMGHLRDQYEALDWVFDFIKSDRPLSTAFIKELHALVTRHQETATGITPDKRKIKIPLLHGSFKIHPNNPTQEDGTKVVFCPPEQVDSEMDAFISVYANEMKDAHILIRAAWTHFTFVQIHPFQDGNGRIARLLTSLVLIQGGLFPFALERGQRPQYIKALEAADEGKYQPLLDMLMNDQLDSMGPEVLAKALVKKASNTTATREKARKYYPHQILCFPFVEQKVYEIDMQLRPAGSATLLGRSRKNMIEIHVHIFGLCYFDLFFQTRIERDSIYLTYSLQNVLNEVVDTKDFIMIPPDMDEETWKPIVEDFIQKKLTSALRYITQSML